MDEISNFESIEMLFEVWISSNDGGDCGLEWGKSDSETNWIDKEALEGWGLAIDDSR